MTEVKAASSPAPEAAKADLAAAPKRPRAPSVPPTLPERAAKADLE